MKLSYNLQISRILRNFVSKKKSREDQTIRQLRLMSKGNGARNVHDKCFYNRRPIDEDAKAKTKKTVEHMVLLCASQPIVSSCTVT